MLKVILIGDSIRMGYEPLVREKLADEAEVWGPQENGGDSVKVLAHLDEWALDRAADVIHFNCGLHDLKVLPGGAHQVPIEEYARTLKEIVERLTSQTEAQLIWATSTPVLDQRHQARKGCDFKRYAENVETYNRKALQIVNDAGIRVNDLHGVVEKAGIESCVGPDGVHMTEKGYRILAETVASIVMTLGV